ncbi:hypothetical protein [Sulfurovum sp.]|uniref:hypothetical protein n=1 Tax=Sulfurovum sp. TaxID=1969726 RepID=UPI002623A01A|nr:hypothetical protein [Sulfurovum sp.]
MRRIVAAAGISMGILVSSLPADHLKNCLADMMHKKDTMPGMVDLSRLDSPGASQMKKSRPSNTVIAIVNGHKIRKKQADAYLKSRTKGKVADFDLLPPKQQKRLVKELSLPLLIADAAKKELSSQEQDAAYVNMWLRKKASSVSVSNTELHTLYDQLKQKAAERNPSKNIIPPFDSIKNKMKSQMIEKKIMDDLMKNAEIEVSVPMAMPPMMIRKPQKMPFKQ